MKIKIHLLRAVLLLATLNPQLSTIFAQGSLTPPGAPAPTMKSLDQIEARTAITNTASLVTLSQPGSYYLMHNLTVSSGDAIDITANQVTLDLNGFTISSTASSATGYAINLAVAGGNSDITIFNGHIKGGVTNNAGTFSGPGFSSGIDLPGPIVQNVRVTGVSVSGCLNYGIYLGAGDSTVVESCTVKTVNIGIDADSVSHCTAHECGDYGIMQRPLRTVAVTLSAAVPVFRPPPPIIVTAPAAAAKVLTPPPPTIVMAKAPAVPVFMSPASPSAVTAKALPALE